MSWVGTLTSFSDGGHPRVGGKSEGLEMGAEQAKKAGLQAEALGVDP